MQFRTELHLDPGHFPDKISWRTPVLALGSCFASAVARRLQERKMPAWENPWGTMYSPLSVAACLKSAVHLSPPDEAHMVSRDGVWFSLDAHSSLWADSKPALTERLMTIQEEVHAYLKRAKFIFITLGTAHVFRYRETGRHVANCQKLPASGFVRERLGAEAVSHELKEAWQAVKTLNPDVKLGLSVSPVRYVAEGLEGNFLSKAVLRLAGESLVAAHEDAFWFPAYELVNDDLRDYRFFGTDMVHPTEQAEEYVWEKFCGVMMDEKTRRTADKWMQVRRGMEHRPFRENGGARLRFLESLLERMGELREETGCEKEMEEVRMRIRAISEGKGGSH